MPEHGSYDRTRNAREIPRTVPYGVLSFAIFLAGLAFVFGIVIILNNIKEPFRFDGTSAQGYAVADIESGEPSVEALKSIDTDGDGLTDYDELYIYRTSPYLKDTDSDGYTDDEELRTGHDPNCASGQSCFGSQLSFGTSTPASAQSPASESLQAIFGPTGPRSFEDFASLSVDQIRQLLLSQGMSKEDVGKIDDQALMEVYRNTYRDFSARALSDQPLSLPEQQPKPQKQSLQIDPARLANPETFTPEEIRDIIRASGSLTEEQLSGIDDQTLKDVFLQTVKSYKP
ncbi:hypothetical protein HYV71_04020 [Candidatus Uhrbacteria bacterium]|nr:hypothetical protein [Candidatus Uhrbacteria bacterium]